MLALSKHAGVADNPELISKLAFFREDSWDIFFDRLQFLCLSI